MLAFGVRRLLVLSLCVACGSTSEDAGAADDSTSSGSDGTSSGTQTSPGGPSAGESTADGTTSVATTSDDSDSGSTSEAGASFLSGDPTGGCGILPDGVLAHCSRCSLDLQDCGRGDACKPWANDGGDVWNAQRCSAVVPDASLQGEPCNVEAVPASGIDSCDEGLVCLNTQGDTLEGECVAFCSAGLDPTCDDPDETCSVYNNTRIPLCLPSCNPLEPRCEEGAGCYPGSEDNFVCLREGERLENDGLFQPDCPSGTFWADEDQAPGCGSEEPCCSPYCDTSEAEPCGLDATCIPFFDPASSDFPNLGYCRPDSL